MGLHHLPDHALFDCLAGGPVTVVRQGLHANLQGHFCLLLFLHHRLRFRNGVRHRLLAVHALAGIHCVDRHRAVPMLGRGNRDVVNVLDVEHPAVVAEGLRFEFCSRHVRSRLPTIGNTEELEIIVLLEFQARVDVPSPHAPHSNESDVNAIVGSDHTRIALRWQGYCRGSNSAGSKE